MATNSIDFLSSFRDTGVATDTLKLGWYLSAATALAAVGAGEHVLELYRSVTAELPLERKKIVQRRIKEAIMKCAILYGVPRSGQALGPLYNSLSDDEIDRYAPRTEAHVGSQDETSENRKMREERGRKYYDTLWTPVLGKNMDNRLNKYHPDQGWTKTMIYEMWLSDDSILSDIETQMCTTACLMCLNAPVQALWHTKGLVRHGGSLDQARLAQGIGLAIAQHFKTETGAIQMVDEIKDW
ncbi:hypothetical protein DL95DRAFT_495079 [Leptodontidium sp. 2 PMI_412]|nr:hypothetical protein DL95DRAFT_495079 [Leptodontidium sp. 2 PMI_412]